MPDELAEAPELRLDLRDRLVEDDEVLARLVAGAIRAARLERPVLLKEAGDARGVRDGHAETDVRVLADRHVAPGEKRQSACGLGHVGHEAHRAHEALVHASSDAEVDGIGDAEVVCADEKLFHGLPLCIGHVRRITFARLTF